ALGHDPEHRGGAVLLREVVGAEARDAGDRVGEVEVARGLVVAPLLGARDLGEHRPQRGVVERGLAGDLLDVAAPAHARHRAGGEVQVGAAVLLELAQQPVDPRHQRSGPRFFGSSQWRSAVSRAIAPDCTSSRSEWSSSRMPWAAPVWSTEWI